MTTIIILDDERFGMRQEFDTWAEFDETITACARDWYQSIDHDEDSRTLDQFTDDTIAEARAAATES